MDTRTSPYRARIAKTQEALARLGLVALLVPSSDPHLSEYLPERWQGRQWLSGFSGSMGTLVVARDKAALFADSRYWVQAEAELAGSGIALVKIPTGASTQHVDWLACEARAGDTVAVDGDVLGLAAALDHARLERLEAFLRSRGTTHVAEAARETSAALRKELPPKEHPQMALKPLKPSKQARNQRKQQQRQQQG
mgnify:CR=1 FL=1